MCRFWLSVLGLCLAVVATSALPRSASDRSKFKKTPLDDYISKPDPHFQWSLLSTYPDTGAGYSQYLINMTSQKWKTDAVCSGSVWWHYLIVVVPTVLRFTDSAFLMVDNGRMTDAIPTPGTDGRFNSTIDYAMGTGSVAADLKMIPNQALHCAGDPPERMRAEDDLIAWTWRRFIDDPSDPEIILQLPMAKAAVRSLDALSQFVKTLPTTHDVTSFMVAGGSKRGWTTYLAAAMDTRIFAIVPEVLSCLNFIPVMRHQYRAYGGWSFSQKDYYNENITSEVENPNMQVMMDIIDPYVYRDRLTMPKLVISATGDEHFMPDDSWYYFKDFTGPTFMWMLEDSGHNIGGSVHGPLIRPNMIAFYLALKEGFTLPTISWNRTHTAGGASISMTTNIVPNEVTAVYGDTNGDERRDFRKYVGVPDPNNPVPNPIAWQELGVTNVGGGVYQIDTVNPAVGWRCILMKMIYEGPDGLKFYLTTETNITPDTFPFEDCSGDECRGILV